jgi:hypothetical protein
MNKKAKYIIFLYLSSMATLIIEVIYLQSSIKNINLNRSFVSLSMLPDLAISNSAIYIRHRSLSNIGDIYRDGLREKFIASSIYNHSSIINNTPSKVLNAK